MASPQEPARGSAAAGPDSAGWQLVVLQLLVAVWLQLLVSVTWPLWTPQNVFPRIPLFCPQCLLPPAAEWLVLAMLLLSAVGRVVPAILQLLKGTEPSNRLQRACGVVSCVCLLLLIAGNQHRLQAWAWHLGLLSLLLVLVPGSRVRRLALYLTASIYVWSAWSKLDVTFFETAGPYLLGGLLQSVGLAWRDVPQPVRPVLCGLLPAAELLIGLGLPWNRSQRLAVAGSWAMHLVLLLTLGPWGLGHSAGVLLWNVFFLLQNPLLVQTPDRSGQAAAPPGEAIPDETGSTPSRAEWPKAAALVLAVAVLLPLFEPWGLCDAWLSWNLYSSRTAQVRLYVRRDVRNQLPAAARRVTEEVRAGQQWCRLRDDLWSLETTGAPILPDSRFRLGVALATAELVGNAEAVRVQRSSRADRLTGRRRQEELYGAGPIRAALQKYWLNAEPPAP